MNRKQYILEKVEKNTDLLGFKGKDIDKIQSYADFFGLIPGVGDIADIVSAAVDVAQGQYGDAGIRAIQAAPGIGTVAGITNKGARAGLGLASMVAPFASGLYQGLKGDDETPETPQDATNKDVQQVIAQQKKLQPGEQPASAKTSKKSDDKSDDKDDSELGLDFGQLFNTRMVSHAPIASFRSLPMQYSSFQQSLDNSTDILMESITGKAGEAVAALIKKLFGKKSGSAATTTTRSADDVADSTSRSGEEFTGSFSMGGGAAARGADDVVDAATRTSRGSAGGGVAAGAAGSNRRNRRDDDKKDDKEDEKKSGKMSKAAAIAAALGGAGLGSRALLASGILGPALLAGGLSGLFGSSSDPTGGQSLTPELGSGSGSGPGAQSALGSVFDRLTSAYGYIPGFNPAGIALQTLGKRVGV